MEKEGHASRWTRQKTAWCGLVLECGECGGGCTADGGPLTSSLGREFSWLSSEASPACLCELRLLLRVPAKSLSRKLEAPGGSSAFWASSSSCRVEAAACHISCILCALRGYMRRGLSHQSCVSRQTCIDVNPGLERLRIPCSFRFRRHPACSPSSDKSVRIGDTRTQESIVVRVSKQRKLTVS